MAANDQMGRTPGQCNRHSGIRTRAVAGPKGPPRYFFPGIVLRNLVFLLIVLAHGYVDGWPHRGKGQEVITGPYNSYR